MSSSGTTDTAARPAWRPAPAPRSARRRRIVWSAVGVVAVVIVVGLALGTGSSGARRAEAFSLANAAGGPAVAYRPPPAGGTATPTVVVFFASWCPPCQAELPAVAGAVVKMQAAHLPVRFLGIDGNDQAAAGLAFARHSGVTFPVGEDHAEVVAPELGATGLPSTVFIDRTGHVAQVVQGPITVAALRAGVARLAG